jgi:hypothetical protein
LYNGISQAQVFALAIAFDQNGLRINSQYLGVGVFVANPHGPAINDCTAAVGAEKYFLQHRRARLFLLANPWY